MKTVLELKSVSKDYQAKRGPNVKALRSISFKIEEGEYVSVQGPSGSGKSTFLAIMGLLESPDKGEVYYEGDDVAHLTGKKLAHVRSEAIGFVFQAFHLLPRISIASNIELPMVYAGVPSKVRKARVEELLKLVGLTNRGKHRPNEISGGEKQRVAIARALANRPALVLADEPTGNLDQKNGKDIIKLLENLNKEGMTLVVITHEPEIAKRASRMIRIVDGKIV